MNIRPNENALRMPRRSRGRALKSKSNFVHVLAVLVLATFGATGTRAQTNREFVGRVTGHDFVIENSLGEPVPLGESSDLLSSGNRLVVRSGQTRILLEGGGDILICGAAQLDVLKSQGAITIALNHGTVRVHAKNSEPVTVFTPLVVATTIEIGNGERDITVGLEQTGEMCVRAKSGAVRIAQQLSGESLLVPQFGGLSLSGGQINAVSSTAPGCTCDADAVKLAPLRLNAAPQPITTAAPVAPRVPEVIQQALIATPLPQTLSSNGVGAAPSVSAPVMTTISPALVFNASNPEPPPDPNLDTNILVGSIRVREETVFRGTVQPKESRSAEHVAAQASSIQASEHPGFFSRIGGFFRHLFGGSS